MGTSTRNFCLALLAALFLHGVLLVQKLSVMDVALISEKPITITLLVEKAEDILPEATPTVEYQQKDVNRRALKPEKPSGNIDELIVVTKPAEEPQSKIFIQTSPQSSVFKNWLKSETDSFIRGKPNAVATFSETFETPPPEAPSDEFTFHNPKNIPNAGTGEFILEKDGKRTCGLKIDSLLSADSQGANGSTYVYADCTPKKKFDLKLNQLNNGWSNR